MVQWQKSTIQHIADNSEPLYSLHVSFTLSFRDLVAPSLTNIMASAYKPHDSTGPIGLCADRAKESSSCTVTMEDPSTQTEGEARDSHSHNFF